MMHRLFGLLLLCAPALAFAQTPYSHRPIRDEV